ncbi:MAG: flagellar hook associated protein [Bdellovibrio sp.]|nr:MAG: flagellar hook associated protein [Bdellovibrio sp.]
MSSGLPPNLVDQLIEAERQPIRNIELRKAKTENRLKLVNDLDSKLKAIQDSIKTLASTRGFSDMKLVSADPKIVDGEVDPKAGVKGSWNVEVLSIAEKAAAITNGFPDRDKTQIGVGYFKFQTPDGEKEVYINEKNNTLQGAANAINAANVGVKASVIQDRSDPEAPFRLMITSNEVGDESQVEYPTLYFLDGDQDIFFEQTREAKNGRIKVDGFEIEIDDNHVKDVIPGVTLNIKKAAPGDVVTLKVSEDREVVKGKIDEFVKSLNAVLSFIQSQNALGKDSDTSSTLGGDGLLRSVESRLRRLIQNPVPGVHGRVRRLSDLGIEYNRNGTLDFKEDKFNSVLASSPEDVSAFFAGDGFNVGFIPSLKREINALTNNVFGPVAMRRKSLQDNIRRMDQRIEEKERQLDRKEKMLRRKFARLEETVSKLKSQGGALAGMGAAIPNLNLKQG